MRLILLLLLPCLATAGSTENPGPRLAPPKGIQFQFKPIPKWNSAEKFRVSSLLAYEQPVTERGRPRVDIPLFPYPDQVPPRNRGYNNFN
jgi:hypothetical protein